MGKRVKQEDNYLPILLYNIGCLRLDSNTSQCNPKTKMNYRIFQFHSIFASRHILKYNVNRGLALSPNRAYRIMAGLSLIHLLDKNGSLNHLFTTKTNVFYARDLLHIPIAKLSRLTHIEMLTHTHSIVLWSISYATGAALSSSCLIPQEKPQNYSQTILNSSKSY